jgi:Flp pilus assembly protein TadD
MEFHKKASQLDPNNAEALNGIGWALVGLGKNEEGINYFHKALSLSPNDATILNYIGLVLN